MPDGALLTRVQDAWPQLLAGLLVCGGALLGGALVALLARGRQRWRDARVRARSLAGEARAVAWLERRGFRILEVHPDRAGTMVIDGAQATFTVRADLLVEKDGRVGVVEVKSGAASTARVASTRRQLLEYAAVYRADDLYLFDAAEETLSHTVFPHLHRAHGASAASAAPGRWWRRTLQVALLAGAVALGWALGRA